MPVSGHQIVVTVAGERSAVSSCRLSLQNSIRFCDSPSEYSEQETEWLLREFWADTLMMMMTMSPYGLLLGLRMCGINKLWQHVCSERRTLISELFLVKKHPTDTLRIVMKTSTAMWYVIYCYVGCISVNKTHTHHTGVATVHTVDCGVTARSSAVSSWAGLQTELPWWEQS